VCVCVCVFKQQNLEFFCKYLTVRRCGGRAKSILSKNSWWQNAAHLHAAGQAWSHGNGRRTICRVPTIKRRNRALGRTGENGNRRRRAVSSAARTRSEVETRTRRAD